MKKDLCTPKNFRAAGSFRFPPFRVRQKGVVSHSKYFICSPFGLPERVSYFAFSILRCADRCRTDGDSPPPPAGKATYVRFARRGMKPYRMMKRGGRTDPPSRTLAVLAGKRDARPPMKPHRSRHVRPMMKPDISKHTVATSIDHLTPCHPRNVKKRAPETFQRVFRKELWKPFTKKVPTKIPLPLPAKKKARRSVPFKHY